MINWDENFLTREKNEEEKLGLRGETKAGHEARLLFSLVHGHTVNHAAVTLKRFNFKASPSSFPEPWKLWLFCWRRSWRWSTGWHGHCRLRCWETPGLGRWSPEERASGPWYPSLGWFWRCLSGCSFGAEGSTDRETSQHWQGLSVSSVLKHI